MTDKKLQKATHEGTLPIGSVNLRVAVLDDGTRVLNRAGVFRAFGRTRRGRALSETTRVQGFPSFIDAQNLQPYISAQLSKELREFEYLSKSGKAMRTGFKASILPEVCDVYLRAREDGALVKQQQHLAVASEIIVRSLSKVGILALVDEATGYQEERERDELQKILAAYISEELLPWTKRFPNEFYQQIYRLKGWEYKASTQKRSQYVGKITNKIVYELLPDGVLDELKSVNPVLADKGHRAHHHHQFLTIDVGNPNLEKHLSQLIVLMRISKDWAEFEDHLLEAFERYGKQTKLHLRAETKPKETPDAKLRKFLDAGGRDNAENDFSKALNKASNPE
ncbi:MAG: phage-related protein [Candidatus Saccharibacteria bacterium]|nr:phage-related protein [Candidatus Saccharibacteria bacterium]